MPKGWTAQDIPHLGGKIALVTGATGGLGLETAIALGGAGARVLLGGRNEEKGKVAVGKVRAAHPQADVTFVLIDQGSLESVGKFCEEYNGRGEPLDILVNNAGVMAPPQREQTKDGFELQFGTNHLSHFALTALLLPSLRRSKAPRVVNVSSIAARRGKMDFEDLNWEKSYSAWPAYERSKLENLLFTFELQRRSDEHGWNITAVAAHPGISPTELVSNGPGSASFTAKFIKYIFQPIFAQSPDRAALPQLFAATSATAEKSGYYGPNGFYEMKGDVAPASVPALAKDVEVAKKLWEESEKLTKVSF